MKPTNELTAKREVTVYLDPITAEKPEGKATLVRRIESRAYNHKPEFQVWQVKLEGQDEPVNRIVAPQHLVEA